MSEIKRGAIFVSGNDNCWISQVIKKDTNSDWSHCGITADTTDFETYILGARTKGVDLITLSEYDEDPHCYYQIYNINMPQYLIDQSLKKILNKYIEAPYGYFQLLGFWIWYMLKKIGITLKRNPIGLWTVCSELDSYYLKDLFPTSDAVTEMDPNLVTPQDIINYIKSRPDIFSLAKEKTIMKV